MRMELMLVSTYFRGVHLFSGCLKWPNSALMDERYFVSMVKFKLYFSFNPRRLNSCQAAANSLCHAAPTSAPSVCILPLSRLNPEIIPARIKKTKKKKKEIPQNKHGRSVETSITGVFFPCENRTWTHSPNKWSHSDEFQALSPPDLNEPRSGFMHWD